MKRSDDKPASTETAEPTPEGASKEAGWPVDGAKEKPPERDWKDSGWYNGTD